MDFDGFDWDRANMSKCERHGVSRAEIESLFLADPWIGPDVAHSTTERRFRAVGVGQAGRHVFAVFTWRWNDSHRLVRPISARYMHQKEIETFEKAIS